MEEALSTETRGAVAHRSQGPAGRRPVAKVAYVEIGSPSDERRVGFASGPDRPDTPSRGRAHDLLDRRLVFVTGKGGVGKTTVAAGLALLGAQRGKRTLVCEVDAKGNLADFYETGADRVTTPARCSPGCGPCRWTPSGRSRSTCGC